MEYAFLTNLAHETAHAAAPFPTWIVAVIGFVVFTLLAVVTMSFRNVANRHAEKAERYAREHESHGTHSA